MKDKDWKDSNVRCCFFQAMGRQRLTIRCEGILKRSSTVHSFRRRRDYDGHLERFCAAAYEDCPFYRSLMREKYPD